MSDQQHLLLACADCRKAVAVSASAADLAAGRASFEAYRNCVKCGQPMEETERGECSHILIPGEKCTCRS